MQLRTLLTMIDNLFPIENQIERKFNSVDYPVNEAVKCINVICYFPSLD
jgi:hypothetical protein